MTAIHSISITKRLKMTQNVKDAGTLTIDDGTDNYDIDYENNLDTDAKNNQQNKS